MRDGCEAILARGLHCVWDNTDCRAVSDTGKMNVPKAIQA
jgi:hypothetical protein